MLLEITAGYYDNAHGAFLWKGARNVPDAPSGWVGANPDKSLAAAICQRITAKCRNRYGSRTLLLVNVPPGVTTAESLFKLLSDSLARTMNRKHWNMLVPTPAAFSEQFAAYAIAYLDSAQRLCNLLGRSHRKATYERGAVVLFLTAHALELFLKGAIVRKSPSERFSHDLEHLLNRYHALYPSKKFRLKVPFSTELPSEMTADEKRRVRELITPPGELYRYPIDKAYKPWSGAYGIEPNSLVRELEKLRSRLEELLSVFAS